MNAQEYVQAALRTEHTPPFISTGQGIAHDFMLARITHAILGKMTELGELADQIKKHLIYGKPLDHTNLVEEFGDGAWYDSLLVNALQIGFEKAWELNIAKLRTRYPNKFTSEQALTRDLGAERATLEGLEGNPKG